ncbi:MAG: M20/M25/M40 family metallo-hydrolase [Actinomycetes bacterium]
MEPGRLEELYDWLRIPSISTGGGEAKDLQDAAEFAAEIVRRAGGEAELVTIDGGNPLVIGELRANSENAPTVIIYGHYDVQGPGPLDAWQSAPFEPEVRGERLYARGAADDKGNFFPLLAAACDLFQSGELAVNVRVVIEGEEEAGGESVAAWVKADQRGADCAIVFDSAMEDAETPAITIGLRGCVSTMITVTAQPRDLHSGLYGGSVQNALHVLQRVLAPLLPDGEGNLREELRAGVEPPSAAELESWQQLRPGQEMLDEVGATPLSENSGPDFRRRNGAEPSFEVNWIEGGAARTVVPAEARAFVTLRLAPGQDPGAIEAELERLLRSEVPAGVSIEIESHTATPSLFAADLPAIEIARKAIDHASGMNTALIRSGGSIPVVADFAAAGIPVIVSGFGLADDEIHAPNESFTVTNLDLGERCARELLLALAALPTD